MHLGLLLILNAAGTYDREKNVRQAIYALISPLIQPHASEPGTYGLPCSLIDTLPATISLTFTSTSNEPFNLTIPSEELSVGPFADNATECQTLINAFDGLELVGGSLLKHYYTVYDVGARSIGFAENGESAGSLGSGFGSSIGNGEVGVARLSELALMVLFVGVSWAICVLGF